MKVQLQSSLEFRKGNKVTLPVNGDTQFDENGIAEVDLTEEEIAELIKAIPDLSLVGGEDELEKQTEENELGKSGDEDNDIGGGNEDALLTQLSGMVMLDLKALAGDSGFDEAEWEKLKKPEIIAYLKTKLEGAAN